MQQHKGRPIDAALRAELARAAAALGEDELARELGLNIGTIARAIGGFAVYGGTHVAVRAFVEARRRAAA